MKLKDNNYVQVAGWMIKRLGLSGTELLCYDIIYGFSQDEESIFMGSLKYLQSWLNVSQPTVIRALKELQEKGYIQKIEEVKNKVRYCYYRAFDVETLEGGTKESLEGGTKEILVGGTKESLDNNNNINNNRKTLSNDNVKSEEELRFESYMKQHYPYLMKMDKPLKQQQARKLKNDYTEEVVLEVFEAMDNCKQLLKKYRDAYKTAKNWCERRLPERKEGEK